MWLWGGGWNFYQSCLYIKTQEQYILEQYSYIALYRQQIPTAGMEGSKYNNNKSLNHATLKHAVHYVTLQNTELAIYQETIQLPQIKTKFFEECTYNTNNYWPYLHGFLLGQEIINLEPVAPGTYLGTQKRAWHQKPCLP